MPSLICTLASFALILILARVKVPLAAAIACGAVAAGLLMGLGPAELVVVLPSGVLHPKSVGLITITLLQLLLSGAMERSGQMQEIVAQARLFLRRPAVTLAALPALIGLLPMPGGALFSAPMVESAAAGRDAKGEWLSAVNYWFRHIWEHWWPLYPGVLLAMTLTNRSFAAFAIYQIPLGMFMVVSGLLLFRGVHPDFHVAAPPPPAGTARRLLRSTASIWMIIALWVPAAWILRLTPVHDMAGPAADAVRRFAPIAAGLAAALIGTLVVTRQGAKTLGALARRGSLWSMIALIVSVMMFQGVLERVEAAPRIAAELRAAEVPPELAVVILPFIAGMVTGLAFGFVGVSFPIVLGLVQAMGVTNIAPQVALAYASGHLGQMLSPIHLCYIVSNRYFKTTFGPVYRHIAGSAALTAALTAAYYLLLRFALQ
jgi:integral membrane protein (TIGR00529 family)